MRSVIEFTPWKEGWMRLNRLAPRLDRWAILPEARRPRPYPARSRYAPVAFHPGASAVQPQPVTISLDPAGNYPLATAIRLDPAGIKPGSASIRLDRARVLLDPRTKRRDRPGDKQANPLTR